MKLYVDEIINQANQLANTNNPIQLLDNIRLECDCIETLLGYHVYQPHRRLILTALEALENGEYEQAAEILKKI